MTIMMPDVDSDIVEDIIPYETPSDGEHLAHIVNPPNNIHIWRPGMRSQDVVDIARARGLEIIALCGFKFVPKLNPDKFPACSACMDIAGSIMRDSGE